MEITQEMIEAGVKVLRESRANGHALVREIIEAALVAKFNLPHNGDIPRGAPYRG